jgi:hypothetical protein
LMIQKRRVQIMGSSFYPGAGTQIARMKLGQRLRVVREPTNKYDKNAVAVHIFNQQLGHFPRGFAAEIAPLMDAGNADVQCWKSQDPKFLGSGIIVVQWEDGKEENIDPSS